ncbi:MAG TPA: phosphatase PAP2 family protein [Gemmatimonadales bacterium]
MRREPFRLIDILMLGYLGVVTMVAMLRLAVRPGAIWVVAANLLIAVLIYLLALSNEGRFSRILREVYPIVLIPALYGALDVLNGLEVRTWDPVVRRWEQALFGEQLSLTWWQSSPSRFWSTVLHAAYFSYYFIIPFPLLYFLARKQPERARTVVTLIVATFLVCYVCFLLFPVAGPYYEFPRPTGPLVDNWAARLVYATLSKGSSYGAAFPSSHVGAAVAAVIGTWLGSRAVGAALAIPTLLLTVGAVYCQMHYVVDAIAGLAVPIIVAVAVLAAQRSAPEPVAAT